MTVRNEEKKAFRDLTPEDKLAIIEAKRTNSCEVWHGGWYSSLNDDNVCLNTIYRTRPRQLVIPWEVIRPEYKWAAMDEDGRVHLFGCKPEIRGDGFISHVVCNTRALNINITGIDWRESLTERPEAV